LATTLLDIAQDFSVVNNDSSSHDDNCGDSCVSSDDVLVYLPITFAGETTTSSTPTTSSEKVFSTYHNYLKRVGHSLEPQKLLTALSSRGISVLECKDSNWKISRDLHSYMWACMYRFLALGVVLELHGEMDIVSWFQEFHDTSDDIIVKNVDILATLPRVRQKLQLEDFNELSANVLSMHDIVKVSNEESLLYDMNRPSECYTGIVRNRYLEFIAPRKITITETPLPQIPTGHVVIESIASLISSGMKYFIHYTNNLVF
jgi:hypothetical protein